MLHLSVGIVSPMTVEQMVGNVSLHGTVVELLLQFYILLSVSSGLGKHLSHKGHIAAVGRH